ncbi:AAA family ATPase [Micromonospora sp. L32]
MEENVFHEFREERASVELRFTAGEVIRMVWPVRESGFFFVDRLDGMLALRADQVKNAARRIGVIPGLTPVEQHEELLSEKYVQENLGFRLSSRHFRNQMFYYSQYGEFDDFRDFILEHTPEISALRLDTDYASSPAEHDLYFTEARTGTEKELYWAGDGMQIWLQLMFHIFRQRHVSTLVLDEPDTFLHPDLQRRLMNLLDDLEPQVILATHAPEMVTEASRDSLIWVDRVQKRARRVRDDKSLAKLNVELGSGFNLGMAKALRSKLALFVEGTDMKVLRNIARTVGASKVGRERGVTVIPLGGFSNWRSVQPFAWMAKGLLGDAVKIAVLLDRDYRTDEEVFDVLEDLRKLGILAHVWQRKELESYLLSPSAISRLSGVPVARIEELLDEGAEAQRYQVQANFLYHRQILLASANNHAMSVTKAALPEFEKSWAQPATRMAMAPPKELLHYLNAAIIAEGGKSVSVRGLSSNLRAREVASEVTDFLMKVEDEIV